MTLLDRVTLPTFTVFPGPIPRSNSYVPEVKDTALFAVNVEVYGAASVVLFQREVPQAAVDPLEVYEVWARRLSTLAESESSRAIKQVAFSRWF
jgi:hypothetical protein